MYHKDAECLQNVAVLRQTKQYEPASIVASHVRLSHQGSSIRFSPKGPKESVLSHLNVPQGAVWYTLDMNLLRSRFQII